jgi:hypothetical protein
MQSGQSTPGQKQNTQGTPTSTQRTPESNVQPQGSSRPTVEQKATQTAERVADKAQSAFESTKGRITHQFTAVARAIESAAQKLDQEQQSGLSKRVQPYVQKAENASRYLQDKSPRDMKDDLDRFARERPAWFLGGAFVAGLIGARFLKSSERTMGGSSGMRSGLSGAGGTGVRYGSP